MTDLYRATDGAPRTGRRAAPWMAAALGVAMATAATANDFSTLSRVEYVMGCMAEHGGQNYNTMYACVCTIDRIAAEMSEADFAEAQVFAQLRRTAGERGSMFRDPPQAKELRTRLEQATAQAERACFGAAKANGG